MRGCVRRSSRLPRGTVAGAIVGSGTSCNGICRCLATSVRASAKRPLAASQRTDSGVNSQTSSATMIARPAQGAVAAGRPKTPIETVYREHGLLAAIDRLFYVGRAITPARSFRRFNTRFFLGDAEAVVGEPTASPELEDAGWHRVDAALVDGFRDVTRFMLERAIALRDGRAAGPPPLFYTVGAARRIGICREAKR